jgi:hypothetical protein
LFKVWEEANTTPTANCPLDVLLTKIMTSTHIFPQRYKLSRIRYEPGPIAKFGFGNVHKGRDLDVYISMITDPGRVSVRFVECMPWTLTLNTFVEHH